MSLSRVPFEEAAERLRISCIPPSVRRRLALFLDTHSGANWEYLAEVLDISALETQWVKDTVVHSLLGSPTLRLFELHLNQRDISLEKLTQALEKIKNLACVRVLTEEYNNGVFDQALKEQKNGCNSATQSIPSNHSGSFSSVDHRHQSSPAALSLEEYHRKLTYPSSKPRNYDEVDGSYSSGSTYNSMEGVAGDSISYTQLDSYQSGEFGSEFAVPMNTGLCRAENWLPSLNDEQRFKALCAGNGTCAVIRSEEVALDLSKSYHVKPEPKIKEERGCCCEAQRNRCDKSPFQPCLHTLNGRNEARCGELQCCEQQRRPNVRTDHHKLCSHASPDLHKPLTCDTKVEGMLPVGNQSPVKPEVKRENGGQNPKRTDPERDCADSRSVRVFVTYSDDSKRHMRKVMQLCDCLKSNNFSVSIDVRENHLLSQDKMGWFDKRFKVADYVLVLISPKYYADVTEPDNGPETQRNESTLNTLYIHRCMQAEYMMNNCLNKRFVPVLMPGATKDHVPFWLKNTTIYVWPDQYKNLFFYMMYPAQVISQFVRREQSARTPTVITTNR